MTADEGYMSKISTKRRPGGVLGAGPLIIATIAAGVVLFAISSEMVATLLLSYPATIAVIAVTITVWFIKVLIAFGRKQGGDD